jgi:hypothetical protein
LLAIPLRLRRRLPYYIYLGVFLALPFAYSPVVLMSKRVEADPRHVSKIKKSGHSVWLSKTRVFERVRRTGKVTGKSGLNLS